MKMKRFIAMILAVIMMLQTFSFALEPKDFTDFPNESHWSYEAMCAALENRLLQGKGDGIIAPADNLTRAEFAAIVTRAFGATTVADISEFSDVKEGDWFYQDNSVAKVKQMGVMIGDSDTTFSPNKSMTRQEVFVALSRALFVTGTEDEVLKKFEDKSKVSDWAKESIIGMVDNSYINGYEEDSIWTLKPTSYITREELAQVFHNLFGTYISDYDVNEENGGIFGGKTAETPVTYEGSVIVRVPDITLKNAVINGDLVIADGVGKGDFDLTNVKVNGRIIVRGGEGKVTFTNVVSEGSIIINDVNGTVNFNNYRDDAPFVGEGKLIENTEATFLKRTSSSGGGSGSGSRVYNYAVARYLEPLEEGRPYDEYEYEDTLTGQANSGTKVNPIQKAQSSTIHGFKIDENGPDYDKYNNGVNLNRNNQEFKVYYKRLSYKISFDGVTDDAGDEIPDMEKRYETELEQGDLPQNVKTDDGVTFEGWSTDPDATEPDDKIVVEDETTLYPVYTYDVTFKLNEAGTDEVTFSGYKKGDKIGYDNIPEEDDIDIPDDKKFGGWKTAPDSTVVYDNDAVADMAVTSPVTLYPVLVDKNAVEIIVEHYFEELDGSSYAKKTQTSVFAKPSHEAVAVPLTGADLPEGFEYVAGHDDEVATGIVPVDGSELVLKLYYNRKTYEVTFKYTDENGIEDEKTVEVKYEDTVDESDIPSEDDVEKIPGKTFEGWSTDPNATEPENLDELEITKKTELYPVYKDKQPVEYTVEHYFENLDGKYSVDDAYTVNEYAVPDFEVEATILDAAVLPEGFEYVANSDELLSAILPDEGITLKVYYNRKTFTVKFEGYSEETYKYGYELALSDIPEDDEVPVDVDKKFMGWSTDAQAMTGTKREDLAGTIVKGDLTYYPIIIDKDLVPYYVEHHFEAIERDDAGNIVYEPDESKTEELYGKIGQLVSANALTGEDIPEGFEFASKSDDEMIVEGETVVLKVYYNRILLKVNFYDAYGDYYNDKTLSYERPSATVEVRYGTRASDEENLEKYIAAETEYVDNYFEFDRGYFDEGFFKNNGSEVIDDVYAGEEYIHQIPLYWWYEDEESGEYKKFYVEGEQSELVFTSDVDVYTKVKKLELEIKAPDISEPSIYWIYYDDETRFLDTVKDALFYNEGNLVFDVGYSGIEDKFYGKLAGKNLMVDVDGNYEIVNINKLIRFARLMGEEGFASFLDSFIDEEAMGDIEQHLFDYIINNPTDETAVHLKALVDDLVVEHEDIAHNMIAEIAEDIVEKEVKHVEKFFMTYTTSLVEADDTDDLEKMICDMFKEYKKTNETEFVAFVSDVIVKALSEDVPNAKVVNEIEKYIKSEVKKGTFNKEIVDYIMDMSDDDFKSAATSVIKEDVSIIEDDVETKILTNDSFVETIIDEIFSLNSETVDKEIKMYIKDYDLADEYIKNNPDVIADYITEAHLEEFYPSYVPGVTFTKQEKIDAIEEFITDNPDTAIDTLKGYVGINLDSVISDYYDNNKNTVKAEIKTEVLVNGDLRQKLCNFAMSLIKDDEFSDLLDFAIEDYMDDVLADEDKKKTLAEEEVDRLKNDKVYNLSFVQDAIDTVIDDVLADIKLYGADGDETTESEYVADIKNYAKSITDFSDIVDAFVHADEDFRNEIIVSLFDNLYESDPEHKIILQFMENVTDKMIDEGDVDVNILITIIDYIKDSGEHGHTLTYDIIEGLMELDEEIIDYAEKHLGWMGNDQLAASLKFRREATYEEQFEVTYENLFIMDLVRNKVNEMTFDKFLEDYVYGQVPENLLDRLPLDDIVGTIYNESKERFINELDTAVLNVQNGMTDQWVNSGFIVSINPVEFAIDMYDTYLIPGYDKANAKAEAYGGRVSELYLAWYRDNPYIDSIVDLSSPDLYVNGTANDSTEPTSGYYIKDFEDIYHNVVLPGSVLGDDLLVWYLEHVEFEKLKGFAEDNEDLILAMYNHPNVLAQRYAQEGLPATMEDYYDDLMENDEIREAFEKIDNKVSFEMEPFVLRFLTNETINMYYNKGLEKFGMKADEILGIYDEKDVKKEITSEDFAKMLIELEEFWKDGNKNVTTDYVLDGFYHNIFSIFSFEKSFRGYTVSFERALVDG